MDYIKYPRDCKRIQKIALWRLGFDISLKEADGLWQCYCAEKGEVNEWIELPFDDYDLFKILEEWISRRNW